MDKQRGWVRDRSSGPGVSLSVSQSESRENGGAAVPGMLGGGGDISISIISSHEAERCSTEGEEGEGEAQAWTITGFRERNMGGNRRLRVQSENKTREDCLNSITLQN